MDTLINILIAIALLVVLATLFSGLFAMLKGGDYAARNSNRLMRWRVASQAVAVVIIVIGFWWKSAHG
jgi:hypothetical protein